MEQVFTEGQACKSKIIESITSAKKDIRIAMAFFTDKEIANQIINAREKGVAVTIIFSDDINNENVKSILSSKCKIYTYVANGRGIMHLKFCIIDNTLLLHGSYNYTYNALNNNKESLNITDSYSLISDYSNIFDSVLKDKQTYDSSDIPQLIFKPKDDANYLETFTDTLKNHISQIFDNFNADELTKEGNNLSRESEGAEAVFINYLDSTLSEVNTILNQNEHTKVLVKTRMTSSLDRAIDTNLQDLESDLNLLLNHSISKKTQIQNQIDTFKGRKRSKQDEFNKENTELSKIKAIVSELNDEIDNLERQIVVRKFWTFPTFFKLFLTIVFLLYLAIFFGSAIWKIFFEEYEIMKLLTLGITPEAPPLFDANALLKIFVKKGVFFGCIATFFFIIPVLLSSIKLLVPNNKFIEYVIGWLVGLFAIDVVVSILISQHTFEINRLVTGNTQIWTLGFALKSGEFWLIFIFGALPLFLTKILIENIWNAYNKSNPESVDRERFLMRNSKKRKLSENNQEAEIFKTKINMINSDSDELQKVITKLEDDKNNVDNFENNKKFELTERSEKRNKNLREIYNSFIASIDSGNKLFLENVVSGRITAFKEGFFLHLTSYYHINVATRKIDTLETAYKTWAKQNFEK
ncbi:MAG: phospholipase D-like domain-containing protein [Chitinophagales bacterium]